MKIRLLLLGFLIILSSCADKSNPKPLGYFRIDLPKKEYELFSSNCSYKFLKSKNVEVLSNEKNCWFDLHYPSYNATVHLTYKKIKSNLSSIIEDSYKLAYDHSIRSDGIIEKIYNNNEAQVYGILYDIHGNSASNIQFFITDSTSHFLRGALYFNTTPNADSLQPVKNHIKEDLEVLIESLNWS